MKKVMATLTVAWLAAFSAASVGGQAAVAQPSLSTENPSSPEAVIKRYCITCHNDRAKVGGLSLASLKVEDVAAHPAEWEKVVRKLRAGLMPPARSPRPDKATYAGLIDHLEAKLDALAAAKPNPGRTEPAHRLNRSEYQNAIRDLFGVEMDVASMLPADDVSYGFDNMAGVLRMSPTLMERYLSVTRKVTRAAVGTPPPFPNFDIFRPADDAPQNDRLEGLPFGTRGGMLIRYNFPADGEYHMRVRLARQTGAQDLDVPRYHQPQELEVSIDGEPLKVFTLPASEPTGDEDDEEAGARPRAVVAGTAGAQGASATERPRRRSDINKRQYLDDSWTLTFQAKAGPREIGVTFLNRAPALLETLVEPYQRPWNVGSNQWSSRRGAYLRTVEIGGPVQVAGVSDTPSRRKIFSCRPANVGQEAPCARAILSTLARRAYRRPVTEADVTNLVTFYEAGRAEGTFETGIELALQRMLMSPDFLFRTEVDPAAVAVSAPYRISDLELASRLSFFLWSSIPDDELLDLAEKGRLRTASVLEQQVRRMLADNRSRALVSNFAGQWLYLRNVPALTRDPEKDPDFDDGLRQAFRRETELFFENLVREDLGLLDLITADYTFLNERLAKHYGIPGVVGVHFRRVGYPSDVRRGLLGHGSVLSVTSYPNRTSPVIRGKWILENLLGTPPPPPPPNVPDLIETEKKAGGKATVRQQMEMHRASPACATCHALMDPLGFALEKFDNSGRLRPVDEHFSEIDTSGVFPDGTKIDGPAGLREALLNHSDGFINTVVEKLLTYSLGRGIESYDAPAIRAIARGARAADYRFSAIILGIVNSTPFQMRRSHS